MYAHFGLIITLLVPSFFKLSYSLSVCFPLGSLQTMTPSAYILRSQRQPVLMLFHCSPKWTLAKVTENKYHSFPLKAIAETRGF